MYCIYKIMSSAIFYVSFSFSVQALGIFLPIPVNILSFLVFACLPFPCLALPFLLFALLSPSPFPASPQGRWVSQVLKCWSSWAVQKSHRILWKLASPYYPCKSYFGGWNHLKTTQNLAPWVVFLTQLNDSKGFVLVFLMSQATHHTFYIQLQWTDVMSTSISQVQHLWDFDLIW